MSPAGAVLGVLCLALLVVFCVCAALLREIMALREQVERLSRTVTAGVAAGSPELADLRIEPVSAWLLAVDASCGLCHEVVDALAADAGSVTLLTYGDPDAWALSWPGDMRSDRRMWSSLAPITPPTLYHVDSSGRIDVVRLPLSGPDAVAAVRATSDADRGAIRHA